MSMIPPRRQVRTMRVMKIWIWSTSGSRSMKIPTHEPR